MDKKLGQCSIPRIPISRSGLLESIATGNFEVRNLTELFSVPSCFDSAYASSAMQLVNVMMHKSGSIPSNKNIPSAFDMIQRSLFDPSLISLTFTSSTNWMDLPPHIAPFDALFVCQEHAPMWLRKIGLLSWKSRLICAK
jgi:hypothetical protein